MTLDEIAAHQTAGRPPVLPTIPYVGDNEGVQGGLENGVVGGMRNVGAVAGGEKEDNAPPRPDPTKPRPAAQTTVTDSRPVRLISTVLQGKAIARPKPNYPPLARQMRLQGDVSVEVIVSPDGRVEAARVISGHPMFAQCAREAALGWRFEPTILNGVPVRVTGVITFVFKMNE
jgi:protein TonB